MTRAVRAASCLLAVSTVLAVHGAAAADEPPPAIDPADLPPLPPPDEEPTSAATVLAAASAEEDVVVGAAKREQTLGNVASAVTVIPADRIRRFGYRTVGEAVAGVAGVYLEDNRLNASLGIRGLQLPGDYNTRILVLVDGATNNEAWGASSGLGFESLVSVDEIARIEVIRGPVSSVYGANAFFGIINIVTRGAAEAPRAFGRFTLGRIGGVIGSAGFAAGGLDRQLRGTVLATRRFGESLYLPEVGSNLDSDGASSLMAGLVGTYGSSFAQLRAFRARRDSPFAPYDGDVTAETPYSQFNSQVLLEGGHTRELSRRVTVSGRGYLNVYRFADEIREYADPSVPFLDVGDSTSVGAELRGRFELIDEGKLGVTAGAESSRNKTRSRAFYQGDEANGVGPGGVTNGQGIPLDYTLAGLYTEVDAAPTSWLGATAGLRFDYNSKVDRRLSPRAAIFLSKPDRYGLKLLYAQGFRNPSAFEYAFDDNSSFRAPRPGELGAERITSFEAVSWAKPAPGLSTRLSGFYWDARDVIVQQLSNDADNPMMLLEFQNLGRFVTQGVEAEASYRTASGWYGFLGGALARVGATERGAGSVRFGAVPDAAPVMATAGVSTPRIRDVAHLSGELHLIGARPNRAALDGSPSPDSPTWVGVNLALYAPDVRGFDVTLGVRNLRGKRDLMPAPGDYDRTLPAAVMVPRVPGEGRELYLRVGYAY